MKTILFLFFLTGNPSGETVLTMKLDFNSIKDCELAKDRLDKSSPPPNLILVGSYCEVQGDKI